MERVEPTFYLYLGQRLKLRWSLGGLAWYESTVIIRSLSPLVGQCCTHASWISAGLFYRNTLHKHKMSGVQARHEYTPVALVTFGILNTACPERKGSIFHRASKRDQGRFYKQCHCTTPGYLANYSQLSEVSVFWLPVLMRGPSRPMQQCFYRRRRTLQEGVDNRSASSRASRRFH